MESSQAKQPRTPGSERLLKDKVKLLDVSFAFTIAIPPEVALGLPHSGSEL